MTPEPEAAALRQGTEATAAAGEVAAAVFPQPVVRSATVATQVGEERAEMAAPAEARAQSVWPATEAQTTRAPRVPPGTPGLVE